MDMQDHARQMAFILLDHLLGEFDLAVKVGLVEFEDDGLSEGTGFDAAQPVPLDQAVAQVDALWCDALGRTGQYPEGTHDWVAIKGRSAQGSEIQVQVNRSANALVGRADLGWRVDASLPWTRPARWRRHGPSRKPGWHPWRCTSRAFAAMWCNAMAGAICAVMWPTALLRCRRR